MKKKVQFGTRPEMKYWHYTVCQSFEKIERSGEIQQSLCHDLHEIPAVWFSSNPDWEETVRKAIRDKKTGEVTKPLSRDELFQEGFAPVRIEISPDLVSLRTWKNHKKKSGITKKCSKALEKTAIDWGADPAEWFVSYAPVKMETWKAVEIWSGEKWENILEIKIIKY